MFVSDLKLIEYIDQIYCIHITVNVKYNTKPKRKISMKSLNDQLINCQLIDLLIDR